MAVPYNHRAIEQKWRKNWEEHPVNVDDGKKPKYYCLDMFPYPSGSGLHVGHWRGYVISDVWSRYKMLQGYYLIHPMGWDAFGLPAENYAIKMGTHPKVTTEENIRNIKRQINEIAAIYDWDMEVNTTDPNFYKWTQWIFVKMFKAGLAYEKEMPDLMLLDITMPGMSGIEVLEKIIERKPSAKVVMCSAVGQEMMIQKALVMGASDFIVKPFKNEEFRRIVRSCLGD